MKIILSDRYIIGRRRGRGLGRMDGTGPRNSGQGRRNRGETCPFRRTASTLERRLKNVIQAKFREAGLDGNGRFEEADSGIRVIWDIIEPYGYVLDMVSKDLFMGPKGSRRLSIQHKANDNDPFTPGEDIDNTQINYVWEELRPGVFEILVYFT